jgi:hypothetical protein
VRLREYGQQRFAVVVAGVRWPPAKSSRAKPSTTCGSAASASWDGTCVGKRLESHVLSLSDLLLPIRDEALMDRDDDQRVGCLMPRLFGAFGLLACRLLRSRLDRR